MRCLALTWPSAYTFMQIQDIQVIDADRCTMVHFIIHFIAIRFFDRLCIFVLLVSTGALQLSFDLVMVLGEVVLNIF